MNSGIWRVFWNLIFANINPFPFLYSKSLSIYLNNIHKSLRIQPILAIGHDLVLGELKSVNLLCWNGKDLGLFSKFSMGVLLLQHSTLFDYILQILVSSCYRVAWFNLETHFKFLKKRENSKKYHSQCFHDFLDQLFAFLWRKILKEVMT